MSQAKPKWECGPGVGVFGDGFGSFDGFGGFSPLPRQQTTALENQALPHPRSTINY